MSSIQQAVDEFCDWAKDYGLGSARAEIRTESLGRPHRPTPLPSGWQGVYCFRYGGVWLKIGMAGPKSGARWLSQHYNPGSAMSTLAFSLIRYGHFGSREDDRLPELKGELAAVRPNEIGDWIKHNTERVNVLIRAETGKAGLVRLEAIAHRLLDPVFEGAWKFGGSVGGDLT